MRIKRRFTSIERYWDRALRFFFGLAFFVSLLSFAPASWAETAPNPELEAILQKIESRHYRWIAIRADVLLFFAKAGDPNAMCGGELLYQRLDERMLLTCVDARQELMFVFRTLDRRFDLYLPSQKTLYHGSIFDLEDSPDIESHLKARDLYRALKPMAVDPRRTKVERINSVITSLDVYSRKDDEEALVRKLYLTPEGDVRGELFYDSKERPVTEIQRYDFREFRGQVGAYDSIIFPKKITITSPATKKGSAIFFTRVTALDTINPLEFILRIPPGTKEIFLDEKDPRFQFSKKSAREDRPAPEATRSPSLKATASATTPAPAPPVKTMPVYLAEPLRKPATETTTPPPARKEKETRKAPEPVAAAKNETSQDTPAPPVSVNMATSENADADIVVEDPSPAAPSSTPDAQTTLDPSVEPSLEMEKQ